MLDLATILIVTQATRRGPASCRRPYSCDGLPVALNVLGHEPLGEDHPIPKPPGFLFDWPLSCSSARFSFNDFLGFLAFGFFGDLSRSP
jgi:hypothetical protein